MENKFVIIDLETTGHSPEDGDRIIEVGIAVIENDQIQKTYSTLINPKQSIPTFISNLTGISDEDVNSAPFFEEIADEIICLFNNAYFVAHNVPFDLRFLNYEIERLNQQPLTNKVLDTVELSRILYPQAGEYKLNQLAKYLNVSHDAPHRALSDAVVTAKIFLKLKQKLSKLPYETMKHLLQLEKSFQSDLYQILLTQKNQAAFSHQEAKNITTYQGLAFKHKRINNRIEKRYSDSFGHLLDYVYESNGTMEQVINHYEKREGQREISETIFDAFEMNKHALIEAGTGVGKSIAYLIPAIYQAIVKNERIVISTYTTQLQAQLLYEEIPLVKEMIPFPIRVTLLKGQNHYISLERFSEQLTNTKTEHNYDIALTKAMILVWITETETGDIDEIKLPNIGYFFFNQICTKTEGHVDPRSPWFHYSYYRRAIEKARHSDLIITNHALLCTDIDNDFQFLPSYDFAIIDEAHQFEHAASRQSALTLDQVSIQYVLNQVGSTNDERWINKFYKKHPTINKQIKQEHWNNHLDETKYDIDSLFGAIYTYVINKQKTKKAKSDIGRIQYRLDPHIESNETWKSIVEMSKRVRSSLKELIQLLETIYNDIAKIESGSNKMKSNITSYIELLQTYIDGIIRFFNSEDDQTNVKWIEIEGDGFVYLYKEATNVSTYLQKNLFNEKSSVVLTSATLTMKKSFSHILNRLGLTEHDVITKQFASPFDYESQVQFLVPNDFPHIVHDQEDEFIYSTCEAIVSLANITRGRILVLFTSYDMLKKCYHLLRETMNTDEFMLIAQGISSGSRSRLKKNFQTFPNAILLGTSSFWEGVDIPGKDLSCLVIVRLPFQPPTHPVYEAKAKVLKEQGKNAFFDLALPDAVIRFKQGFGRLIRSKSDRGIVFVCDTRIVNARYSSFFTDSIPSISISHKSTYTLMEQADKWFNT